MFGGNTRGRGRGGSNSRDRTRGGGNRSGSSDSKSSNLSVVDQARIAREERAKAAERGKQVRQLQAVVRGFNTRNAVGRRLRAEVDKKLGDIERLGTLLAQQAAKAAEKKRAEAVMAAAASGGTMKPPVAAPVATGMRVPLPIAADVCRKLIKQEKEGTMNLCHFSRMAGAGHKAFVEMGPGKHVKLTNSFNLEFLCVSLLRTALSKVSVYIRREDDHSGVPIEWNVQHFSFVSLSFAVVALGS